jgi:hypothetical protein
MISRQHRFILLASLFSTILAAPAPATTPPAKAAANPALLIPINHPPINFDYTVLSFNYYEDSSCGTQLGSMNISSLDLMAQKCFALPGNSLIFTFQQHEGTLSYYNPNEVNSE